MSTTDAQWRIRYAYNNPSGAGPYKGGAVVPEKMAKGDFYRGPFGAATVTSCSKARKVPSCA